MPKVVNCPTCGKPVEWVGEQPWRPFCSERCRLIDLGEWADEGYRIPAEPSPVPTADDEDKNRD